MPPKPKRPCRQPMCSGKTQDPSGFCDQHAHLRSGWNKPGRQTAEARGYGYRWRKLRALVLERDRHMCQCDDCGGKRLPANEVDHILPKSRGGTDDLSNLRAISAGCHRLKTQREAQAAR